MNVNASDSLSVREGLVQIVSAERFRTKPRSGANTRVVVMEEVGGSLRHYTTLHSADHRLSIGEQLWGNYVCFVVDMSGRRLRIADEFPTADPITTARAEMDIHYHAADAERVVLGVSDALLVLRDDLIGLLRRELGKLALESIDEERLERRLLEQAGSARSAWGLVVSRIRLSVSWSAEKLAHEKRARAKVEDRRSEQQLELEDLAHIEKLLAQLGLAGHWPELRLKLLALPRNEAYEQISALLGERRQLAQKVGLGQLQQDHDLIKHLIDVDILEDMDLEDFKKRLLTRNVEASAVASALGRSPLSLFGIDTDPQRAIGPKGPTPEETGPGLSDGAGTLDGDPETPDDSG